MKKVISVFLLLTIIFTPVFSSCKKSKDTDDASDEPIRNVVYIDDIEITLSEDKSHYDVSGVSSDASGQIIIPGEFNGLPIVNIKERVFCDVSGITSVIIEEGIQTIGAYAFENCSSLETVNIPKSVQTIGTGAYFNCNNLRTIKINSTNENNSLMSSQKAFVSYCSAITQVSNTDDTAEITDFLSIADESFKNTEYYNDENNWEDGALYIDEYLIAAKPDQVSREYSIKNGTKGIASGALRDCTEIVSVNIPNSVRVIEYGAFFGCNKLTEITIPDSVIKIGDSAFAECTQLLKITISDSVRYMGGDVFANTAFLNSFDGKSYEKGEDMSIYIGNHLIKGRGTAGSREYTVREGTKTISELAFIGSGLVGVTIPSGISSIGFGTFRSCANLKYVNLPNSVKEIAEDAFCNCSSLESITIPEGVNEILFEAFRGCKSLTSTVIPDSVTKIDERAFAECTSLKNITFGNGLQEIGKMAFRECTSLEKISLPNSLLVIADDAFMDCFALSDINTIPDSVVYIGTGVFSRSAYIDDKSNWENGVLYIGNHLIKADHHQVSGKLEIKQGTLLIANYVFSECGSLTEIIIPESVSHIGRGAFSNSSADIYFEDTENWVAHTEKGPIPIDPLFLENREEYKEKYYEEYKELEKNKFLVEYVWEKK